jgi:hypothetical protein
VFRFLRSARAKNETQNGRLDKCPLMKYICADILLTVSNQQFLWTQTHQ